LRGERTRRGRRGEVSGMRSTVKKENERGGESERQERKRRREVRRNGGREHTRHPGP